MVSINYRRNVGGWWINPGNLHDTCCEQHCTGPEFIDPVFAKTSPKRSFSMSENERFGLDFAKTVPLNTGTVHVLYDYHCRHSNNVINLFGWSKRNIKLSQILPSFVKASKIRYRCFSKVYYAAWKLKGRHIDWYHFQPTSFLIGQYLWKCFCFGVFSFFVCPPPLSPPPPRPIRIGPIPSPYLCKYQPRPPPQSPSHTVGPRA